MSESILPRLKATSSLMKKIDRLGWEVGFSLKSYGVRIGIRSNDPAALASACEHLPSEWQRVASPVVDRVYSILIGGKDSRSNGRRLNHLYSDDVRLARSSDKDGVFETLESDLRLFVAELATHRAPSCAGSRLGDRNDSLDDNRETGAIILEPATTLLWAAMRCGGRGT